MNNDENMNNQRGGNGTAPFTAYEAKKNAARLNGQNLGKMPMNGADSALAKKALSKMGPQGKIAAKALDVANKLEKKTEEQANEGSASSLASAAMDTAAKAKDTVKKVKNIKKNAKLYAIIAGAIIGLFGLIIILAFMIGSMSAINEKIGGVKEFFEKTKNLIMLDGFKTDYEKIQTRINDAAEDYEFIDKGMLYAIANNGVIFGSDVFEKNDHDSEDVTEYDSLSDFALDSTGTKSFYDKKQDLVGELDDVGTAIDTIIGRELSFKCVEFDNMDQNAKNDMIKGLKAANKKAIRDYMAAVALKKFNQYTHSLSEVGKAAATGVLGKTYSIVNEAYNVIDSGYSALWTNIKQKAFAEQYDPSIFTTIADTIELSDKCIAAGGYPSYTAYEINDYTALYAYTMYIYTPTMYSKIWNDLDSDTQNKLVKETWADIVMMRNQYYSEQGENNFLGYYFDEQDEMVPTLGAGSVYISNIPLSADASIVFGWRQGTRRNLGIETPWSTIPLGREGDTMDSSGCLVTSVAKLMKLSGTTINSPTGTFDPGTLARSASFTVGGSLIYSVEGSQKSWYNLAPNFYYKGIKKTSISVDNSNLSGLVSTLISTTTANMGLDSNKCYYTVQIGSTNMPTHFVAVVGSDENGLIVSDPAVYRSDNTYHLNDIRKYYSDPDLDVIAIQVYLKTD